MQMKYLFLVKFNFNVVLTITNVIIYNIYFCTNVNMCSNIITIFTAQFV